MYSFTREDIVLDAIRARIALRRKSAFRRLSGSACPHGPRAPVTGGTFTAKQKTGWSNLGHVPVVTSLKSGVCGLHLTKRFAGSPCQPVPSGNAVYRYRLTKWYIFFDAIHHRGQLST
jgi:hypothetical protein